MKYVLVMSALLLTGCINESTHLVSDTGGSKDCKAFSWGLIGYPIAKASYESCLKAAKEQGYHP